MAGRLFREQPLDLGCEPCGVLAGVGLREMRPFRRLESAQVQILKRHGVRYGQGFYFSQPLPIDTFMAFVRESNRDESSIH